MMTRLLVILVAASFVPTAIAAVAENAVGEARGAAHSVLTSL